MEYEDINLETKNDSKKSKKKIFVFLIFLLTLLIYLFFINNGKNDGIENELLNACKEYVRNNNIVSNREIYIDNSILNVDIGKCDKYSGVFVNGNIYTPYLKCDDYQSKIVDNGNYKLNGDEVVLLPVGIGYNDPGVFGHNYQRVGSIGKISGVYNIGYKVDNNIIYRKVVLIDNSDYYNDFPIIKLKGDSTMYLYKGTEYQEIGYDVEDKVDYFLYNSVIVNNNVDVNTVGEYDINYSVTNSRGYSNTATRRVIVLDAGVTEITYKLNTEDLTNEDVTVFIEVFGNVYSSMDIYSNNIVINSTTDNTCDVVVKENSTITVKAYNKDDTVVEKTIVIENIDKSRPKGSCVVDLYYDHFDFKVTDSDFENSYIYSVDNDSSSKSAGRNYSFKSTKRGNKYTVKIINKIGTENVITCSTNEKIYRKEYVMSNGKKCLEGFVCFNQGSYSSSKYIYRSSADAGGPISSRGCSLVSATIILSGYTRKGDGSAYDPYETFDMVKCGSSCGFAVNERMLIKYGNAKTSSQSAGKSYNLRNKTDREKAIEYLRRGYQLYVHFDACSNGCYLNTGKHFMSILGINAEGKVYLRDTHFEDTRNGIEVNTFISIDDVYNRGGNTFVVVGPSDANFDL